MRCIGLDTQANLCVRQTLQKTGTRLRARVAGTELQTTLHYRLRSLQTAVVALKISQLID